MLLRFRVLNKTFHAQKKHPHTPTTISLLLPCLSAVCCYDTLLSRGIILTVCGRERRGGVCRVSPLRLRAVLSRNRRIQGHGLSHGQEIRQGQSDFSLREVEGKRETTLLAALCVWHRKGSRGVVHRAARMPRRATGSQFQ